MARTLSLSNGSLLIALDENGFVRDFYFPQVGLENHVSEKCRHRLGISIDGVFSWLESPIWSTEVKLIKDSMIGITTKTSSNFPVRIEIKDAVYNEKNIFLREINLFSTDQKPHIIKFFFNQEFQMAQNEIGDTAYYYPVDPSIIHYHGNRVCLVSASFNNQPFSDYTTGVFGIQGKEGSYKDAEDGFLTKNPIEHGRTDSVISITVDLPADYSKAINYWITAGTSIQEAQALHYYVKDRTPKHLFETTGDFWEAWLKRHDFKFYDLDESIVNLFYNSLLYCRGHCDQEGAIIASADSGMLHGGKDTYSYMWPRDASFNSLALNSVGETQVSKRFYTLMNKLITPSGFLMHKYLSDGSLGSSWHPYVIDNHSVIPIQEDETALVIWSLFDYYLKTKDLEFIETIYNSFIRKSGNFLIEHIDQDTSLPKPSYDLWEEKFGVHTFTAASVYGALNCISSFAKILGKNDDALKYSRVASNLKNAILKNLYDDTRGIFLKSLSKQNHNLAPDKTIDSSSAFGIWFFKVLNLEDDRLLSAIKKTKDVLTIKTEIGGIARYENDSYYNKDNYFPGNPWFITTFWYAQIDAELAKNKEDLEKVKAILDWATKYTYQASVLAEQLHPYNGSPISAGPLAWSHADYVRTVIYYLEGLKRLGLCLDCNPL